MNNFLGKSELEFWQTAENWYARTHRLREIWQDERQPIERKLKAILLWHRMFKRIMLCVSIASEISKPRLKGGKMGFVIIDEIS